MTLSFKLLEWPRLRWLEVMCCGFCEWVRLWVLTLYSSTAGMFKLPIVYRHRLDRK
jgi:hypothetical protein